MEEIVSPNGTRSTVSHEAIGRECMAHYWMHHDKWKAAKAKLDMTPWWRFSERKRLDFEYGYNLRIASDLSCIWLKATRD